VRKAVDESKVHEEWAEEGGLRLHVSVNPEGLVQFSTVDITSGWPGREVASVSLANYRLRRVVDFLRPLVPASIPKANGLPIDQMLRDADLAWKGVEDGQLSIPFETQIGDLSCHVRALVAEVERLERLLAEADATRKDVP
jgi:hypothetical protein